MSGKPILKVPKKGTNIKAQGRRAVSERYPGYAFLEAFDPERVALIMICATLSGPEGSFDRYVG
jgi:hypothetical protein